MAKTKRVRRKTVFGVVEGDTERVFLEFLRSVYAPNENNIAIKIDDHRGGDPNTIVSKALEKCDRNISFAWFDEDFEPHINPLNSEIRRRLLQYWNLVDTSTTLDFVNHGLTPCGSLQSTFNRNKRNPIIVVSKPVCFEGLILRILEEPIPFPTYDPNQRELQIEKLKTRFANLMAGKLKLDDQLNYYVSKLDKAKLESRRTAVYELDLLISFFTN